MHIITSKKLRDFANKHGDVDVQLRAWESIVKHAKWNNAADVKMQFPYVSVLKNDRFCFNVKGNHYRLAVKVLFNAQQVLIRFIGTHADYDRIDANTI
tara:strand:+ start:105 stop:398 length:294 start_codon:yes stop_codon:yes gene_type:complete